MCIKCHLCAENSDRVATLLGVITGLLSASVSDISDLAWEQRDHRKILFLRDVER